MTFHTTLYKLGLTSKHQYLSYFTFYHIREKFSANVFVKPFSGDEIFFPLHKQ